MKFSRSGAPPATAADAHFVAGVASVNLLPADIMDELHLRTLRLRLVIAGLAVLVLLAAGYVVQASQLSDANTQLAAEQARGQAVLDDQAELAPVKAFYAEVTVTQQQIMTTMAKEVLFSDVTTRLSTAAADAVTLGTVSLVAVTADLVDPAEALVACPGSDPFTLVPVVGCITVAGTASSREDVGDFVSNILTDEGFAAPFVATTVLDEVTGLVAFTGTISLTAQVYSGRYNDVEFLAGVTG